MSISQERFESVCARARQAMLLHSTADTLEWDERTGMPVAAGEYRAQQISTLRALVHERRTDPQYGEDLQHLLQECEGEDPHGTLAATVQQLHRDWQRDCKLPTTLVESISQATVRGQQTWDAARQADDFSIFESTLGNVIDLKREAGQRLSEGTDRSVYEALLDEYEPDARVEDIQQVFDDLRTPLVQLIAAIKDSPQQPNTSILERTYCIDDQRDFSHYVAEQIGFDFDRGRLDETSHPFCTTLGPHDCRILTRYDPHWLPAGPPAAAGPSTAPKPSGPGSTGMLPPLLLEARRGRRTAGSPPRRTQPAHRSSAGPPPSRRPAPSGTRPAAASACPCSARS